MAMVLWLAVLVGGDSSDADLRFFEQRVRPVLAQRCWGCHGPTKQKGNLRLDSRERLLRGGQSGPAIEVQQPSSSLLLEAIQYQGLEMPPAGRLPEDEIAALTRWIERGAVWPSDSAPDHIPGEITEHDRAFWSFQPLRHPRPAVPTSADACNPIDAFLATEQQRHQLPTAAQAPRHILARRAYQDVLGLPPTPEEVLAFIDDSSPHAFEALIDRMLARPEFGQKWARHWLDLVRYAESDGFKQDAYRPYAWRYRDYVINAFNSDKPFDAFIVEQLAGDEIAPDDPQVTVATAFLRHGIYEYNQRDVRTQWDNMLNELVDVTADVFLGLGVSCARCHDHKFDPVLQRDYFRMRAFFEAVLPRDDLPFADSQRFDRHQRHMRQWEAQTQDLRSQLAAIEEPLRQAVSEKAIEKFPLDVRPLLRMEPEERSPAEQQIAALAERQLTIERENVDFEKALQGDVKERWQQLRKQLEALPRPAAIPAAFIVHDVGPRAPPTTIPGDRRQRPIQPGFLSVLDASDAHFLPPPTPHSTGRRLALAEWIASPHNPLTARVIVNRLWQRYFGRGLVATTSDFGRLGERPTHPDLLDWLAEELISHQWSLKHIHRLILTSQAYRRASSGAAASASRAGDPDNLWLARGTCRRLEAEQIRDAMLAVSGELKLSGGGPADDHDSVTRTVYTKVLRNQRLEIAEQFDGPDGFGSVAIRNITTTPLQALFMINSSWSLERARAMAGRLLRECERADPTAIVRRAYWLAYSRPPLTWEEQLALEGLSTVTASDSACCSPSDELIDLCHILLNSSEFVYLD